MEYGFFKMGRSLMESLKMIVCMAKEFFMEKMALLKVIGKIIYLLEV